MLIGPYRLDIIKAYEFFKVQCTASAGTWCLQRCVFGDLFSIQLSYSPSILLSLQVLMVFDSGFLEVALEAEDLHHPSSGFGFVTVINNLDSPLYVKVSSEVFPKSNYDVPARSVF